MSRPAPQVSLKSEANPWSERLDDGVVLMYLTTASTKAEQLIQRWIDDDVVDDGEEAVFAMVILDPTRPRGQLTISERIVAYVLFGDPEEAMKCLPNAAAKADATDRHGVPNGKLVAEESYTLGNGDFAWGNAAMYGEAIAAGSGLSQEQDEAVALLVLTHVMDAVHGATQQWLQERRQDGNSQSWFNRASKPGNDYRLVLAGPSWRSPSFNS